MSVPQAILTALFCMAVVFAVLLLLWAAIRLLFSLIKWIERKKNEGSKTEPAQSSQRNI